MLIRFNHDGYQKLIHLLSVCQDYSECKRYGVCILGCEVVFDFINVRTISINTPRVGKECTGEMGKCGCMHAEESLALEGTQPELLICSHSPCPECYTKFLDPRKIRELWYITEYRAGLKFTKDSLFPLVRMDSYDKIAKRWQSLRDHK